MKKILAIIFSLTLCAFLFAEIEVPIENRVPNIGNKEEPGFCAWACIEILGRQHKVKSLYDLVENRSKECDFMHWDRDKGVWVEEPYIWIYYKYGKEKELRCSGSEVAVINKLDVLEVKYRIQRAGDKRKNIIKYAMDNELGCMIVVSAEAFEGFDNAHAIILTHYDEKEVRFIDPNNIDTKSRPAERAWFDYFWTGYTLVIEKQ
jgi:hypothetical protein